MSPPNSDPLDMFDDAEMASLDSGDAGFGFDDPGSAEFNLPTVGGRRVERRGFDIYSLMLILSFLMLTAASIMLFMDAAKY